LAAAVALRAPPESRADAVIVPFPSTHDAEQWAQQHLRPHRYWVAPSALDTAPALIGDVDPSRLRRTDRLGGLIHDYRMVA